MQLVLSTLFIQTQFKLPCLVTVQLNNIKFSVLFHKRFKVNETLLNFCIDSEVAWNAAGNAEAISREFFFAAVDLLFQIRIEVSPARTDLRRIFINLLVQTVGVLDRASRDEHAHGKAFS